MRKQRSAWGRPPRRGRPIRRRADRDGARVPSGPAAATRAGVAPPRTSFQAGAPARPSATRRRQHGQEQQPHRTAARHQHPGASNGAGARARRRRPAAGSAGRSPAATSRARSTQESGSSRVPVRSSTASGSGKTESARCSGSTARRLGEAARVQVVADELVAERRVARTTEAAATAGDVVGQRHAHRLGSGTLQQPHHLVPQHAARPARPGSSSLLRSLPQKPQARTRTTGPALRSDRARGTSTSRRPPRPSVATAFTVAASCSRSRKKSAIDTKTALARESGRTSR